MVCNTFLIIPLEGLTWNKMCLAEKHVTLRESKLLVQYAFHNIEVRKNASRSNIETADNIVLFFHDLLCFPFFQNDTRQAENLHSQRSRKTHKLVLKKPFLLESFLLIVILFYSK